MAISSNNQEKQYKVLLIGDQAVGKSSLLSRYVDNIFETNIMGTAGLDLKKKTVKIKGEVLNVCIFDTAGHERFRSFAKNQYSKADGILIVYDITDKKSFEGVNMWVASINKELEGGSECLLIGNKIDLESSRVVSTHEGEELAKKYKISFIETSAKLSRNVNEAFLRVINQLYEKDLAKRNQLQNGHQKKKQRPSGCCYAAS